jgi:hypothetical protein
MEIVLDVEPDPDEHFFEIEKEEAVRQLRNRNLNHEMEKWWDKPVPNWTGARCAELLALEVVAPDTWFPGKSQVTKNRAARETAIGICETCPIIARCRDYGLENESHGIWGGVDLDPPMDTELQAREMNRQGKCRHGHDLDNVRSSGQRWCSVCESVKAARVKRAHPERFAGAVRMEQVRHLLKSGLTIVETAREMRVSTRTVERYRKQLKNLDSTERKAVA